MSEDLKRTKQKVGGGGHAMGGFGGNRPGLVEKPKNLSGTLKKLVSYMRPMWVSVILVVVFAIASTVFAIISPKILGNMTNQVVNDFVNMKTYDELISKIPASFSITPGTTGADLLKIAPTQMTQGLSQDVITKIKSLDLSSRPQMSYSKLLDFAYELIALYLASTILSYIQGWIMSGVSQKITYNLRRDISKKINRLPLSYFDKKTFGEVLSRVTNDVDTVSQTLNQSLTQIITSATTIIGILIMMFSISWQMTLVALVSVSLSFVLIGVIIGKSQKFFKQQQESLGDINGHIEEMYSGHNVMRVFNGKAGSINKFEKISGKLFGSAWKAQFLSGLMFPIMNFIGNLSYVAVSVLGGWLAIKGRIQIGDIQAFLQYVNQFNQPIAQTANIANVLQSTAAAAERVFEFLGEKEENSEESKNLVFEKINGSVDFENVVFGYDEKIPVIRNFSAQIKPGQRVAIVGPTGAGKTTIVNLLMRFYEIDKGSIKIDGTDISDARRSEIRKLFGMVLQDTWLFNGTIKENIAYGNKNATDKEIVAAAKAAHADHFIRALPQGYELVLNEEADNISQGEKQLLTIARAMLTKTPMLILDEATSSVDTRTELLIQRAMENLMKNKTSFIIAHRLSTIRDADLILVMNEGNIIEHGTHDQLLSKNGFYASLYNSQFTGVS